MIEKIKSLAQERKITLKQLEEACGIGQKSIYNWDKSVPAVDKVKRVADYFGVTVDELVREGEKKLE